MDKHIPIVLSIAGSDPSAGAGMQADLRVTHTLGCYGMGVLTAITAQSTLGVSEVWPLSRRQVAGQAEVLLGDIVPDAVKVGMLGDDDAARGVLDILERYSLRNVVVDTIMRSSSGATLFDMAQIPLLYEIMRHASVITPNLPEAEALLGEKCADAETAVRRLAGKCGGVSVLLKGGHGEGGEVTDTLYNSGDDTVIQIRHPRINTPNTHGTGCVLSSALACLLAQGRLLGEAAREASSFVHEALAAGRDLTLGHGHGPAFVG